jgi:FKBP-type peptidyl-prolyl cis-trans isomerase (trigger factor)
MNTTQTSKGELLAGIQVTLVKADYEAEVTKALKDYQHKATMPGFRQGKVPFGMIKKMYGQGVLIEKINQKVSEALNNHIIENKLDVIGYPLPDLEQGQPNDLDTQEELNFYFEAALKPEINVVLKDHKINDFNIKASAEEIDRTIKSIQDNNKVEEQPAELNEELFAKIFPGQEVKDVETFRAKVAVEMEKQYVLEAERMFYNRAVDQLVEEIKFNLADTFLKRWIVENSEGKITAEDVEKNYDNTYVKSLRWQLIEEALVKQNNDLMIKEAEVREFVRNMYFGHMDVETLDEETKKRLEDIIDAIIKDDNQRQNINNQLADKKLTAYLKENMTVTVVDTDYEGFVQAVLPQVELAGEAKPKKTRAKKAAKAEETTEETAE